MNLAMLDNGVALAHVQSDMATLAAPSVDIKIPSRPQRATPNAPDELPAVHVCRIIAPLSRNALGGFHRFDRVRHLRHSRIPIQIKQVSDVRFADAQHISQFGLRHAALAHLGV